jgi:hypothetical protein
VNVGEVCKGAVAELRRLMTSRAVATEAGANQAAAEICREVAGRHGWTEGSGEWDELMACLKRKAGETPRRRPKRL